MDHRFHHSQNKCFNSEYCPSWPNYHHKPNCPTGPTGPSGPSGSIGPTGNTGPTGESAIKNTWILVEVKPNAENGGTLFSGILNDRDINAIQGSYGNNTDDITIEPDGDDGFFIRFHHDGIYKIRADIPAIGVSSHRAILKNITFDNIDLYGSSSFTSGITTESTSRIEGIVTIINTPVDYKIQQIAQITKLNDGKGRAAFFGPNELYSTVNIDQLQRF